MVPERLAPQDDSDARVAILPEDTAERAAGSSRLLRFTADSWSNGELAMTSRAQLLV
jgi:hypothetical protein